MRIFEQQDLVKQISGASEGSLSLSGALNKWYYSPEKLVIKESRFVSDNTPKQSHLVEVLGSRLCQAYGIDAVHQEACLVHLEDGSYMESSFCRDFRRSGEEYLTIAELLLLDGIDANDYAGLSGTEKIQVCLQALLSTGLTGAREFLSDLCLIDFLLLNIDRHCVNFGILRSQDGIIRPVPLFDFGMGLKAYDAIAEGRHLNITSELSFFNPFAIQFLSALSFFGADWKAKAAVSYVGLPLNGITWTRQDLFYRLRMEVANYEG
jgi:hypothetical protein